VVPVVSYKFLCEHIQCHVTGDATKQMFGLLFAQPYDPLVEKTILPHLSYWNQRSGNNINLYFMGYMPESIWKMSRTWACPSTSAIPVPILGYDPWVFSSEIFNGLRTEIAERTVWEYSGNVDLLLANVKRKGQHGIELDFSSALRIDLAKALRDGAIFSIEQFFENLFRYAERPERDDPTWGFSDEMGLKAGRSAIKDLLLSCLPEAVRRDAKGAFSFVVSDISR
jgi:hypothetical protein